MKTKFTALPAGLCNYLGNVCVFIALMIFCSSAMAQSQLRIGDNGEKQNTSIDGTSYVKAGQDSPYPSFVRMAPASKISHQDFIPWLRSAIALGDGLDFQLKEVQSDELGFTHYRYTQTYMGIPIDPSGYIVHVKNGYVASFNGKAIQMAEQSPIPLLSSDAARSSALTHVGAEKYAWENTVLENELRSIKNDPKATYFPAGELVWRIYDGTPVLAYKFDIYSTSPDYRQRVYVNAGTGAIVATLPLESNCDAATVNTIFDGNRAISTDKYTANDWRLRDDCQGATIRIRDWNSATTTHNAQEIDNTTNTWTTNNERFGGSVLWQTKNCYQYFLNVHGRNSYDNAGGNVEGYINAIFGCGTGCTTANNASMSFTGGTMKVGLSSAGTLANSYATQDIIAHEYAHAVTGATSMLDYNGEPGGLNESFSDIFGEVIERWQFGSNDWLMGSQRTNGAIRDMANPKNLGQPDTYLGTNWVTVSPPCNSSNDECGVHTNSGVQNYWFFLVSQGGSGTNDNGDDYQVDGIGMNKARLIAYRNLVTYLGAFSAYSDARDGAIQAAIDLYGLCSAEVEAVTDAWHAVGVGSPFLDLEVEVTSDYNGEQVSCFGECDGQITATVEGTWITDGVTVWNDRCPGAHVITATDVNGCQETVNLDIIAPDLLVVSAEPAIYYNGGYTISCNGGDDGEAEAIVAGGTPPYTYLWNTGENTAEITGLTAGNYSVTVTDANGCTANDDVTLTEPPPLTLYALGISDYNGYNISCFGGSDGEAEAFPGGGLPPYSYEWNDPINQTLKVATGLMAKTYTVEVTDDNYCTIEADVTLTEPPALSIEALGTKTVYYGYPDSACADLSTANATGGVPPYTLEWSTGETTSGINVCPDTTTTYTVTITDQNGCTFTDSVLVCVIDVRCGNKLKGILICHSTNGVVNSQAPGKEHSISMCVGFNAVANHLSNHGDQLADCEADRSCSFDNNAKLSIQRAIQQHEYYLEAAPNPFNNHVSIRFIPEDDYKLSVNVIDATGKVVDQIFEGGVQHNTLYTFDYHTETLPQGLYFFRLESSTGMIAVEKMILSR